MSVVTICLGEPGTENYTGMNALLRRTISYHDYREDFYHAFLAGIFTGAGYMVDSNKEHLAYEKTNQEERKEQPT